MLGVAVEVGVEEVAEGGALRLAGGDGGFVDVAAALF